MQKTVHIVGIPTNLGQRKAGVEMGSDAIRSTGLHEALTANNIDFIDSGNIPVPAKHTIAEEASTYYRNTIATLSEIVAKKGEEIQEKKGFALYLGGDHSMAIGTIAGSSKNKRLGVLWVDAHGDFNTEETTPSNNIHGMPLAISCGLGNTQLTTILGYSPKVRPEDIVILGARDLDTMEKKLLEKHGVLIITNIDVQKQGILESIKKAKERLKNAEVIHISFDVDSLDPSEARGVGTPVPAGLTLREACTIMEEMKEMENIISMDITETNPLLDDANKTAHAAHTVIMAMLTP